MLGARASTNRCVSALGGDASVVVKEEVVEPALVEQLRSSHPKQMPDQTVKRAISVQSLLAGPHQRRKE